MDSITRRVAGEMPRLTALRRMFSATTANPHEILEFSPYGYDERQYCSPGFNLPVGCLMRSVWGSFPEYHTSADNLEFIRPLQLAESLRMCAAILDVLENNRRYCNLSPYCEPQLGRRNLYRSTGGNAIGMETHARLWVLNLSDGEHSLLDIAERSGVPFSAISEAAKLLCQNGLLSIVPDDSTGRNDPEPKLAREGTLQGVHDRCFSYQ